jgi:hypothetical protein
MNSKETLRPFNFNKCLKIGVLVGISVSLIGCSSVSSVFGSKKSPPDEFAVVTKAPLVMPPDYALRPPRPGEARPQDVEPGVRARQSVFGIREAPKVSTGEVSEGEVALLAAAGAEATDPNIRRIVDSETFALADKDQGFADRILFWERERIPSDAVVDPAAEAERIRRNESEGRPTNEGQTPTIETDNEGFFDWLF